MAESLLTDLDDSPASIPSGTVTFLFTDIQGSTQLLERLREQYALVLAEQRDVLRAIFAEWNGHEIDTQGDAFFVAFPRALDAVSCAIQAQRALAAHTWPQNVRVYVRMGLHTGEPIIAKTGYVGMDVHLAARIGAAGYGGQILLSKTTRELVYADLPHGVSLRDLGEHKLKDIRHPQVIYQVEIDGLTREFPPLKTLATGEEPPTPGNPPFKGLQFFDEADADLFFGRETMTAQLIERIQAQRFLAIIGASGSGKSSIMRAGVVPQLKRQQAAHWHIHVITPTSHPLEALAASLTHGTESVTATTTLIDDLAHDHRSLHLYVRKSSPAARFLIVIDQFEELFTLCRNEAERQAFVNNLLYAQSADGTNATIVIVLRADFYEHLAQYATLREAVAKHQEYLGPMSAEELREAIEEPAKRGGWEFSPGLVDLMLHDVGATADHQPEPGALPLLSHALLETWRRRRGNVMTLKGYSESGGVRGAIARTAETVYYTELNAEQRLIARSIFLRLTELGEGTQDTRRRASLDELFPPAPFASPTQVEEVLVKLADARLITTGEGTIEVAHEALIREWSTLREWLTQNREGLRLHRHLTEAAQEWELLERDASVLYRGTRLAQAVEWAEANPRELNAMERAFLDASKELATREESEREAQRKREVESAQKLAETEKRAATHLRRRAIYLSAALIVAAVLAIVALIFGQQSNNNAQQAQLNLLNAQTAEARAVGEAQTRATAEAVALVERGQAQQQAQLATSRELAAAALSNLTIDPERSILLAMRGLKVDDIPETQNALHQALLASRIRATIHAQAGPVYGIAISPDGRRWASAGMDGSVKVWAFETSGNAIGSAPLVELPDPIDFNVPTSAAGSTIAFSPDSRRIAAISAGKTVKIWDAVSGQLLQTLAGHSDNVYCVAFSPDGQLLATGSADQTVKIWDVASGRERLTLSSESGSVYVIAFSPDGKVLAAGSDDGSVNIWDLPSAPGAAQKIFTVSAGDVVQSVAFSPDGNRLAISPGTGVQIWNKAGDTWAVTPTLSLKMGGHGNAIIGSTFSPDGLQLVTGSLDGQSKFWDAETGQELFTVNGAVQVNSLALSPDGTRLLTADKDGTVKLYDVSATGNQEWFDLPSVYAGQFSRDGKQLMTRSGLGRPVIQVQRLQVTAAGVNQLQTLQLDQGAPVSAVAFSRDLDRIVTVGGNMTAKFWDTRTGQRISSFPLTGVTNTVFGLALSPDNTRLATGSDDGTARIWDLSTGQAVLTLTGHTAEIRGVAYSPDGQRMATASYDGNVRIWDAATGALQHELAGNGGEVISVAFSPDSLHLLTASSTAKVWDVVTGKEILSLTGLPSGAFSATFSPDGTRLATGSIDNMVRVWDASTGQELLNFPGMGVGFTPDGQGLIAYGVDGIARGFILNVDQLMDLAASHVTRALTIEECQKYLHLSACPK